MTARIMAPGTAAVAEGVTRRRVLQGAAGAGGSAVAAVATACAGTGGRPAPNQVSGSVTVWGSDAHREVWKTAAAEFTASYPNVTVTIEQLAVPQGGTADDGILAAVAANTAADTWVHDVTPS